MSHPLLLLILLLNAAFPIHVESEQEFLSRLKAITDARLLGPENAQDRSLDGVSLDKIGVIKSASIHYRPPSGIQKDQSANYEKILKELNTYRLIPFEKADRISHPKGQLATLFLDDGRLISMTSWETVHSPL